jgi:urea transport system substrate-binding protein
MPVCSRRDFLKGSLAAGATVASGLAMPGMVGAQEPIKVGVLHSLSGTMAISEAPLKEVILMAIAEVNAGGGVLGRKVEAVVEDPASNWDLFAEKSKKLLLQDKVAAVFGCWTSVSRKSVLPVFEKNNGLLFYPVQYEGEECSKNVIYTGATINQQATPGVDYLMGPDGGARKKFYLLGSDYVYPRTTNKILRMYLTFEESPDSAIGRSTPPSTIRTIRRSSARSKASRRPGTRRSSTPSTATATWPFSRSWPTRG